MALLPAVALLPALLLLVLLLLATVLLLPCCPVSSGAPTARTIIRAPPLSTRTALSISRYSTVLSSGGVQRRQCILVLGTGLLLLLLLLHAL